jgi:uncharacterized protein YlaI
MILKILRCDICNYEEELENKSDSWKRVKLKNKYFHVCSDCMENLEKNEIKKLLKERAK